MKQIPEFPEFKKLEITDKEAIEKFTEKFPPYSDFNFTNLWCWDIREKIMLSQLNGNLVVKFYDFITDEPFLSFIGETDCFNTAQILLTYSEKNYGVSHLKLLPECSIQNFEPNHSILIPDENSHDYVCTVELLAAMDKLKNNGATRRIKRFLFNYPEYSIQKFAAKDLDINSLFEVFKSWAENKGIENYTELNEFMAFNRMLQMPPNANFEIISFCNDGKMIAFYFVEIVSADYALGQFIKGINLPGITEALICIAAQILQARGIKYLNIEEDMGIEGMRNFKQKLQPSFFLKKNIYKRADKIENV